MLRLHTQRLSSQAALALRRALPSPQALPFLLRKSEVVRGFDDWAERHDAAGDLSTALMGGKWTRQHGVSFEPYYVPFWSFETLGSDASVHHHMYAGEMDAISLTDAWFETAFDSVPPS